MKAKELIQELPKGILNWYHFSKGKRILCISDKSGSLADLFTEKNMELVCAECEQTITVEFSERYTDFFDYIIAINTLEQVKNPVKVLKAWKKLLKSNGTLLLGMENRLGLRYFCGDQDPFTKRNFDGIENYRRIRPDERESLGGRTYAKSEIENMLDESGWESRKFYSVLPELSAPQLIYAEGSLPKEELAIRYFPMYHNPDTIFLEEEYLYTSLIKNGLFHAMANAYLIECSADGDFYSADQITVSVDRGRNYALCTVIHSDGQVEKRALYKEGEERLRKLEENTRDLQAHGLCVVNGISQGDIYKMPYIDQPIAADYMRKLIRTNKEDFIKAVDHFRELILHSSDIMTEDENMGIILKRGYIDLVPLNSFYEDGDFLFFDQEFWIENYPANVIITRTIDLLYQGDLEMESILPREFFMERYGLQENLQLWRRKSWEFIESLRNERLLQSYHERYRGNLETIHTNRQRMNYSTAEYQRLFVDLFRNTENKEIILFGSGSFAKKFLALYRQNCQVSFIIDNNKDKWGKELEGIPIKPVSILSQIQPNTYKVIICIKNYVGVVKQLQELGVKNYAIYDSNQEYPQIQAAVIPSELREVVQKKYHIGYIAGVFDLFHIGHLNMFKRAKEQCDYLIVGVVTDKGVEQCKKTEPFIPFEERIEMVRSCKYVDEAVEIPLEYGDTKDAYRKYRFDCQFSGSDYMEDPDWEAKKVFLEKHGSELVFFPYTESTSSTKLKRLIEQKMI